MFPFIFVFFATSSDYFFSFCNIRNRYKKKEKVLYASYSYATLLYNLFESNTLYHDCGHIQDPLCQIKKNTHPKRERKRKGWNLQGLLLREMRRSTSKRFPGGGHISTPEYDRSRRNVVKSGVAPRFPDTKYKKRRACVYYITLWARKMSGERRTERKRTGNWQISETMRWWGSKKKKNCLCFALPPIKKQKIQRTSFYMDCNYSNCITLTMFFWECGGRGGGEERRGEGFFLRTYIHTCIVCWTFFLMWCVDVILYYWWGKRRPVAGWKKKIGIRLREGILWKWDLYTHNYGLYPLWFPDNCMLHMYCIPAISW